MPLASGGYTRRVKQCLDVLGGVILPRLSEGDADAEEVRKLITEFDAAGAAVQFTLPSLLRLYPEDADATAHKIRSGLMSTEFEQLWSSIRAVYEWIAATNEAKIVPPPADLLHEVGHLISVDGNRLCHRNELRWHDL
jgi:hypothetical protein